MADGDVNSRTLGRSGNLISMSGTLEADGGSGGSDGTAVYLSGSSSYTGNRLVTCLLNNMDEPDEAFRIVLNSNDDTEDSYNGAVYVTGEGGDVETYQYYCLMTM